MTKIKDNSKNLAVFSMGFLVLILFIFFPIISRADPLDNWHWRNPLPQGNTLSRIIYGNSTFVAVGDLGTIITSADGITWSQRTSGSSNYLSGITYGNSTFVAVGGGGTILTSADGIAWISRTSGTSNQLKGITYANHTFVAVGGSGIILTSADGITWNARTSGTLNDLYGISYGNNTFVAVGYGYTYSPPGCSPPLMDIPFLPITEENNRLPIVGCEQRLPDSNIEATLLTSPDGIIWTPRSSGVFQSLYGIIYGNNTFIAAVSNGTILSSGDGITWTNGTSNYSGNGIIYVNNTFVAVGNSGIILSSGDGLTWIIRASGSPNMLYGITYGNSTFVAVGDSGTILTSADGITWTSRTSGSSNYLSGIAYGKNTFVAVGNSGTIQTSADGITWISRTSGSPNYLSGVTYGNNTFVAVGDSGTILTSTDGITWASVESYYWFSGVAYGNNTFVAVTGAGAICSSADASTWSCTWASNNSLRGITYGNNTFVAVGDYGAIMTSVDGTNWTSRTSASSGLHGITYANNTFVAVGGGILTSADGTTWINREPGFYALLYGISYGKNYFVAVGDLGTIMNSVDAITWTKRSLATYNPLRGITYGSNTFVAVGGNGTILQSETPSVAYSLSVSKTDLGTGTVISVPNGLSCGSTCSASYATGTRVTLTAAPDANSTFAGWSGGGCSGTGTCTVTMDAAQSVIATFNQITYTLSISKAGAGAGTINSDPSSLSCGSNCSALYGSGTTVTLTATPDSGSVFAGWSGGGCSGTGSCTVTMNAAHSVTATFNQITYTLSISKAGLGAGAVTSDPGGLSCGSNCSASYVSGTTVTLTATPSSDSTFAGWSGGGCSGTGSCTVTMDAAQSVIATFNQITYTLSISKAGAGAGTINSDPSSLSCGSNCSASYGSGTTVTLTATPDSGSVFAGWSGGGCSGTGSCTVTMNAAHSVTATFNQITYTLSISKAGLGAGAVTSDPSGLNCGSDCSASYVSGTTVTLTATPSSDSTFAGWFGGSCTGTGNCTLTMDAAQIVTATFSINKYSLTVVKSGSGTGTVTGSPTGIDCGSACNGDYYFGTQVMLIAAPTGRSKFTSWTGCDDANSALCYVSIKSAVNVTAIFSLESAFTILKGAYDPVSGFLTLSWSSESGQTYDLQYSDDPFGDNMAWTLLEGGIPADNEGFNIYMDDGGKTGKPPGDPTVMQRYYRVAISGSQNPVEFSRDWWGLFTTQLVEGMNLVSFPLIPESTLLNAAIGNQLRGDTSPGLADRIWFWNRNTRQYEYAWLSSSASHGSKPWRSTSGGWPEAPLSLESDKGFWIQIRAGHGGKSLKLCGRIAASDQVSNIITGMQLFSSPYPVSVNMNEALKIINVAEHGSVNPGTADRVWYWNRATQQYEYAWLSTFAGKEGWRSTASGWPSAGFNLIPGQGYWFQVRDNHPGFSWMFSKPY